MYSDCSSNFCLQHIPQTHKIKLFNYECVGIQQLTKPLNINATTTWQILRKLKRRMHGHYLCSKFTLQWIAVPISREFWYPSSLPYYSIISKNSNWSEWFLSKGRVLNREVVTAGDVCFTISGIGIRGRRRLLDLIRVRIEVLHSFCDVLLLVGRNILGNLVTNSDTWRWSGAHHSSEELLSRIMHLMRLI